MSENGKLFPTHTLACGKTCTYIYSR